MSISFDAYKMFYFTGKYMNITRAASELFLSQSTVSRGLQSLESFLGCRLFERTRNGVVFTPEGEELYGYVSKAYDLIMQGEEHILQKDGKVLRIGAADFVSHFFVMPVLEEFHRTKPDIKLEIVSKGFNSYAAAVDSLLSGKTDMACVAAEYDDIIPNEAVNEDSAASFHDILIAGERFSELRNGCFSLEELNRFPFASLNLESSAEPILNRLFRNHGFHIKPEFETDSLEIFRSVVCRGRLLALIPEFLIGSFSKGGQLFEVKVREPLPSYSISVLTVKDAMKSNTDREFISRLTQNIQSVMSSFSEPA